jgi:hypothetical protein
MPAPPTANPRRRGGGARRAAAAVAAAVAAAAAAVHTATAACPNLCNGHGRCVEVNRCECFGSWAGGDCSLRKCPEGPAWADVAAADDAAHSPAVCSARGHCDHKTGQCMCMPGYEGLSCNRMICPEDCAAHGRCHSMRHHAETVDRGALHPPAPYTNVRTAYPYRDVWDADMIHGCTCDSGYDGWDCGERRCAGGDDPLTTGQADDVQLLRCDIDPADPAYAGPQLSLSFRGAVTRPLSPSASAADVRDRLEELPTVGVVDVTFTSGGVALCNADFAAAGSDPALQPVGSNVVMIRFVSEHGDVPRVVVLDERGRPLRGAKDNLVFTAAKGDTLIRTTSLAPVTTEVVTSVTGNKENLDCSGRGRCNRRTGVCDCFTGFTGSDGRGGAGTVPDCGHAYLPITSCPGTGVECSGHGTCSGNPSYLCTCYAGWAGGDCSLRTCPFGRAWFDYPAEPDVAHAPAECSNKGACNRLTGECACQEMFEGEACERMTCPGKTSPLGVCSGHGRCLAMAALAEFADANGDPTPFTYGVDTHKASTWDAHSVQGCLCDAGWTGYDCSGRTCPLGNDITLLEADDGRLDEAQRLACAVLDPAAAPTFRLSFRGDVTDPLRFDATAAEVEAALEALPAVGGDVAVVYAGSSLVPQEPDHFCLPPPTPGALGQTVTVYFNTAHGDLPPLRVAMDESSRDPVTGAYGHGDGFLDTHLEFTGGDPADAFVTAYTYHKTPTYPASGIRAQEIRKGSSGNAECSGRGICNRGTGLCQCFLGFGASNDSRGPGTVENCGWREPYVAPRLRGA